jgi:hypothetical protein
MPPQRSDLVLSTNIPNIELDILICDSLDVKPYGRDCGDVLIQLQFIQYRCLSSCIQPQHQQAHLFRSEDLAHHFGNLAAHDGDLCV